MFSNQKIERGNHRVRSVEIQFHQTRYKLGKE